MDKNAVIEKNCEDDIPLLEIRTSPEENIEKVTSEDPKDSASSACDKPNSETTPSEDKESPNNLSRSGEGQKTQDELSTSALPEESKVKDIVATASSEKDNSDPAQDHASSSDNTEPKSPAIINEQQKKLNISKEAAKLGTTPHPGVTPLASGVTKVDISHLPILSPAPLSDSPVRKLDLTDTPVLIICVLSCKQVESVLCTQ